MIAKVLATEFMKLHRAKETWATLAVLALMPLGIALFMWIVREPGRAAQLGLLGAKASLAGLEATWPQYFYMLTLVFGVGGMLLLAFIVAYLSGREYRDATAKNRLALPVARHWFAVAKLAVAALWWMALIVLVLAEAMAIGLAMGLPGFSVELAATGIANAFLASAVSVPARAGGRKDRSVEPRRSGRHRFLARDAGPGEFVRQDRLGGVVPYSIVPLLIGMVADPVDSLPAGSYVVLAGTFAAGTAATVLQLRFADNAQ